MMTLAAVTRFGVALLVGTLSSQAFAADPVAGKRLVEQWCINCHVVGASDRGTDAAPALPTIAQQQKGKDPQWVKAWLQAPHPPMPNFNLSRQEIDDIAAYLATLPQQ
jgi:mono/diheme cytochrome c family protein